MHDDSDEEDFYIPGIDWELAVPDDATASDLADRREFLDAVASGTSVLLAGIQVGWSPARVRKVMADKEFADLVNQAHLVLDARVEGVIHRKAVAGVEWAVKLYAFNRLKDRWKDVRHIDVTHAVDVPAHLVAAVREEAKLAVAEMAASPGAIAALQQRNVIDVEEVS